LNRSQTLGKKRWPSIKGGEFLRREFE